MIPKLLKRFSQIAESCSDYKETHKINLDKILIEEKIRER